MKSRKILRPPLPRHHSRRVYEHGVRLSLDRGADFDRFDKICVWCGGKDGRKWIKRSQKSFFFFFVHAIIIRAFAKSAAHFSRTTSNSCQYFATFSLKKFATSHFRQHRYYEIRGQFPLLFRIGFELALKFFATRTHNGSVKYYRFYARNYALAISAWKEFLFWVSKISKIIPDLFILTVRYLCFVFLFIVLF